VYIFRHGETYYNRSKRFTGWVNSRLTSKGISQIKVVAEKLRDIKFQVAFKTSLSRSSDSLKIVLKHHPECKRIIVDDRIRERSYGDLEGKYHRTIIERYGKKQFDVWHRSYDVPPPGGESIRMVEERVLSFIEDMIALMKREWVNVVIAAHGNSMRPFKRHFEDLTIEQMMKLKIPFDEYYAYNVIL
jgi:2,3-bisphosphoglycerate-dependent phosphoglycerate mutase